MENGGTEEGREGRLGFPPFFPSLSFFLQSLGRNSGTEKREGKLGKKRTRKIGRKGERIAGGVWGAGGGKRWRRRREKGRGDIVNHNWVPGREGGEIKRGRVRREGRRGGRGRKGAIVHHDSQAPTQCTGFY